MSETDTRGWVARLVVSIFEDQFGDEQIKVALAVKRQNGAVINAVGGLRTSVIESAQEAFWHKLRVCSNRSQTGVALEGLKSFLDSAMEQELFAAADSVQAADLRAVDDRTEAPGLTLLSAREREVATLLAEGYANLNIAARLDVSENTIRTYVRRVYRKLGISTRVELARIIALA